MNSTNDQIKHSTATDGKPPVSGSAYPDNENGYNDYWEEINEQERERKTCMYCGEVSNSTDDGICYPCYRQHCR